MLTPPVQPMLAATTPVLPEPTALRGGCIYQPKFDGYRALVFHQSAASPTRHLDTEGRVVVQSRAGNTITSGFPEIVAAVVEQVPPGTVLDGELVVWDGRGVNFAALAGRLGAARRAAHLARQQPATLMVFDLLAVEGTDVRRYPLRERQEMLTAVLDEARPPIQLVPSTRDVALARTWVKDYCSVPGLGIEGLVIKGASQPYVSGGRGWLKYRVRQTHDVVVGAVTGHVEAPHRLVLGYYAAPESDAVPSRLRPPDGVVSLRMAGATIPLGARQSRAVGALLTPADDPHPWPEEMPAAWLGNWGGDRTRVTRVQPLVVVEISADTAFEHGRWRHQVRYLRVRHDKNPDEVTRPDAGSSRT